MHSCTYQISTLKQSSAVPLIDRRSNRGVAGGDVPVMYMLPQMKVNIKGIDCHQITNISLATVGGVVDSSVGPVIIVRPSYALARKGATIMHPGHFEYYGQPVDNKSAVIGKMQSITTPNGVVIPVDIVNGLARIPIRPYTDHKFNKLPTILLADNSNNWNPSFLNSTSSQDEYWLGSHPEPTNHNPNFLMTGEYLHCTVLLSDIAWTFDAWGDHSAETSDKEIIIFEHPTPNENEAIKLETEADVPDLVPLLDNDVSVSSSKSSNTSKTTYCDLDNLVDNVVDYMSVLKNLS